MPDSFIEWHIQIGNKNVRIIDGRSTMMLIGSSELPLEKDELFLRADRIEIPASITAVGFYKKQGYDYKNGLDELDDEGHYRLEKFNARKGGNV